MKKDFIVLEETAKDTQKIINHWITKGFKIEIIAQNVFKHETIVTDYILITSLWIWKEK